jgi:peptidoglycan hydrolase-like protein with peptidoglycan-binding domain
MKRQLFPVLLVAALLSLPQSVHALTATEIQAQIHALTAQLAALTQKQSVTTTGASGNTTIVTATYCPKITRTLVRGSRGSDVTSLQQFLIARGLLSSDSLTGYFGAGTEGAVQRFQAGNGIVTSGDAASTGYGAVGARTRASIASVCAGGSGSMGGGQQVVSNCPVFLPIDCKGGTLVSLGMDAKGCSKGTQCVITQTITSCRAVTPPVCPGGQAPVQLGFDSVGCNLGYQCPSTNICSPVVPPVCSGGTLSFLGFDAQGCARGYQCVNSATTITPASTTTTPSLKLSAQVASTSLSAAWQSDNAPVDATVSLYLTPIDGIFPATITSGQPTSGTFFWSIPSTYCSGTVCGIPVSGQYHLRVDVLSGTQVLLSKESDNFTLPVH